MNQHVRHSIRVAFALGLAAFFLSSPAHSADASADAAAARTRKLVRMLDDIYKGAIVLITEHYVQADSDLAAGEAFKALFATMRDKGWHEVRLLDATGSPISEENAPKDDFERTAIKELRQGKPYYERIETRDGRPFLRAATPIPVVMQKCVMCHENYKNVAKNQAIGALGYTLKIE